MRLQLIILTLMCPVLLFSQENILPDSLSSSKRTLGPVDVNFLFSYYDQGGDHSAVTGGQGTEKLEDYATKIIINVPFDTVTNLSVHTHVNYYSSASTDRINENVSSASSGDVRSQFDIIYSRRFPAKNNAMDIVAGGSVESDYISGSLGGQWTRSSQDKNKEFNIGGRFYFDAWRLIFPDELRATAYQDVTTDKRRTLVVSLGYSQVFTKRFLASISTDVVYQNGMLSTPFHRVYFRNTSTPRIEKLPANRIKLPVGLRLNYFFGEHLITRFYYRFYYDNFGIIAHTLSLELPVKIVSVFSIAPFYRFYIQTKADYFYGYGEHEQEALFYTSDYDFAALMSHKVGIGINYSRSAGILKVNKTSKRFLFTGMGARYSQYFRSDGLIAFIISLQVSMNL